MSEETTNQTSNPEWMEIAILVSKLLFNVVLPGVANLIVLFKKNQITIEDLRRIADLVKRPEDYFQVEQKVDAQQG